MGWPNQQLAILKDETEPLTSLSSTASRLHSSRHSRPPRTQSDQGHGGTSGGNRPTCCQTGCYQYILEKGQYHQLSQHI